MSDRRYTDLAGEDILLFKRRYTPFQKKIYCALAGSWMAGFLLMLLTLTACVGEELQKPLLGEGEGYLTLQVGAISAEIQTSPLTKTPPQLDASLVPSIGLLTINITNKDTKEVVFSAKPTGETITKVLKTGTYIVEAYHGTDNDIQETPYFYDRKEVKVESLQTATKTIVAKLANAMIIPIVTDSLKKHYMNDWTLTAFVGETSFLLASATEGIDTLYAKVDKNVSFTFAGTNKVNNTTQSEWSEVFNAPYAYQLQCNPDLNTFKSIQVTATAKHTKDSNGDLNGTEVVLNSNLNDANGAAIETWNVEVKYNGTTIRSYSGSAPNNLKITDTNGWPYIPQDSKLSASVKLKAGDVIDVKGDFAELPKPKFTVTASAYTSYNKYTEGKSAESKGQTNEANELIAAANGCDGSTIYDMKAVPTISETLLTNSNYSGIKSSTLKLDNGDVTITDPDSMAISWGPHTLEATYTFDGVTVSGSETYHVTGLPFSAVPPKVKGDHAWTYDALDAWGGTDEYARIGNGGAGTTTLQSPSFHVPTDIDIPITISYHSTAVGSYLGGTTFQMYLGETKIVSFSASKNKENEKQDEVKNQTMSSSQNYIKCTNSYSTLNPAHSRVYYVNINYR